MMYCLKDLMPEEKFWLGFYLNIFNSLLKES